VPNTAYHSDIYDDQLWSIFLFELVVMMLVHGGFTLQLIVQLPVKMYNDLY